MRDANDERVVHGDEGEGKGQGNYERRLRDGSSM